jgi:hypothetical protein
MGPLRFISVELLRARTQHWSVRSPEAVLVRFHAPGSDVRTEWEEWLAAGALRDRSGPAGLPPVSIIDGRQFGSGRLSGAGRTRIQRATPAAVLRLRKRLFGVARRSGARVDHLTIVRPYGIGYALVLRARRPAFFLHHRMQGVLRKLDDRWVRYEGAYFEVVDIRGRRVWATAGSSRLSSGAGWIRPDLAGCDPISENYPPGHKVPRCPV